MNRVRAVRLKFLGAVLLILAAPAVMAAEHVVVLKKKSFDQETLSVSVGDTVVFRNDDPIDHDILSQSATKVFDLDAQPPGENRKVSFDKPGTVEVECSIHEGMHLTIQVGK
jgi:plastocyanin